MAESVQTIDPGEEIARAFDRVFSTGDGPAVLDHLELKYRAQRIYHAGGIDGQRETDRRAAQKEVIDYVLSLIHRAQRGDRNE